MSNTKWKKGLLKTGLPLESVVTNELSKHGHMISGEYPYIRPNESNQLKEFSVDIKTFKSLDVEGLGHSNYLELLVECKYRQPGTSWVFSPYPSETIMIGLIHTTEDIQPYKSLGTHCFDYELDTGFCIKGVEISVNGEGYNDNVRHGVFQLRYAMPVLMNHAYEMVYDLTMGKGVFHLCPILVTTAVLRVFKPNLSMDDFQNAESIDEVTEIKKSIIINEDQGPQLKEFSEKIANKFIDERKDLEQLLSLIDNALTGDAWKNRHAPDLDTVKRSFNHATERVLIVNNEYLDEELERLETSLIKSIESTKIYGHLEYEVDKFTLTKK